jgi:hypothetical protein
MRVRINNGNNVQYDYGDYVEPLNEEQELLVVADPGKTNMAMVIGNIYGEVLRIYEFSGVGMDTSLYCREFRRYVMSLLGNCKVFEFAQEKAILKDGEMKEGYKYYTSNMVLTEIRAILIDLAYELTGKKSYEINNWSWKFDVLPKGFRGKYQKGSLLWLSQINPMFAEYKDDVTDVICMYMYRATRLTKTVPIFCGVIQKQRYDYNITYVGQEVFKSDNENMLLFRYNPKFSCQENAIYFSNHTSKIGMAEVPMEYLKLEDLYKYKGINLYPDSKVFLLVKRK